MVRSINKLKLTATRPPTSKFQKLEIWSKRITFQSHGTACRHFCLMCINGRLLTKNTLLFAENLLMNDLKWIQKILNERWLRFMGRVQPTLKSCHCVKLEKCTVGGSKLSAFFKQSPFPCKLLFWQLKHTWLADPSF